MNIWQKSASSQFLKNSGFWRRMSRKNGCWPLFVSINKIFFFWPTAHKKRPVLQARWDAEQPFLLTTTWNCVRKTLLWESQPQWKVLVGVTLLKKKKNLYAQVQHWMAHRQLVNFLKVDTTTLAKNTTWGKQSQKVKNSTKEGFSFRALILTIKHLTEGVGGSTVAQGYLSFWKQKRKQTRSSRGITPQIKFSLEKNSNNSGSHPSLCWGLWFIWLCSAESSFWAAQGRSRGRERKRHKHRKKRREKKKMAQRLSPDCRQGDFPGRNPGPERLPDARWRATRGLRCPLLGGPRYGGSGVPGKGVQRRPDGNNGAGEREAGT